MNGRLVGISKGRQPQGFVRDEMQNTVDCSFDRVKLEITFTTLDNMDAA